MPHFKLINCFDPIVHSVDVIFRQFVRLMGGLAQQNEATWDRRAVPPARYTKWASGDEVLGDQELSAEEASECLSIVSGEDDREGCAEIRASMRSHRRELVNLPGIAERVAARYEEVAEARSVHIVVDVAPDALVICGAVSDKEVTLIFSSDPPCKQAEVLHCFQNGSCSQRSRIEKKE